MKKEYTKPTLREINVDLSDIIAVSSDSVYNDGGNWGELHQ